MAWIELHQGIFRHRKIVALAAELGVSRIQAGGHVISLWLWALDNAEEGDLSGIGPEIIAFGAEWEGDPVDFTQALEKVGLVDREGDTLSIHHWWDYVGRLVEKRRANAERQRAHRERVKATPERDVTVTCALRNAPATPPRNALPTPPHPTVPNQPNQPNPLNPPSPETHADEPIDDHDDGRSLETETAVDAYEQGTARPVTPMDVAAVNALVVDHGQELVIESIREAAAGGNWRGGTRYIERILQRWQAEGRTQKGRDSPRSPPSPILGVKPSQGVV